MRKIFLCLVLSFVGCGKHNSPSPNSTTNSGANAGLLTTCHYSSQLSGESVGTIYTVDPSGSDGNTGSSTSPWKTLQHAADSVQPGDTVSVNPGNYQGFNLLTSGTSSKRITFEAKSGVVITKGMSWGGITFGMNTSGGSYITVRGFTFSKPSSDPDWYACIRMGGIAPGGPVPNWAAGNVMEGNTCEGLTRNDQLGFFASWQDGLIVENNISTGAEWDSMIYVSNSSKNYFVCGNNLYNGGGNGIHNNGDASQGGPGLNTNAVIERNVIHDLGSNIGGQAISCDGLQNSRIQNNLVYNTYDKGLSLYVVNSSDGSKNNVVVNNTIFSGVSGSGGVALRIDGGSTGNIVFNNIFAATGAQYDWIYEIDPAVTLDYNSIMEASNNTVQLGVSLDAWHSWGYDNHSILALPSALFVNSGSDFHLSSSSPAIGKGVSSFAGATAPSNDFDGKARDPSKINLGAF